MRVTPESENLADYLRETEIIDFSDSKIKAAADRLSRDAADRTDWMKRIYEFVRDKTRHSADIDGRVVTLKASDVLKENRVSVLQNPICRPRFTGSAESRRDSVIKN